MAIYHFHLKKVSKSKGINGKALKHAKYILREDEYENKGKTVQIIIPNNASNQEIKVILNDIIHELEGKL